MKSIILRGRKVVGGTAEGEALVTSQTISAWGGTDPTKGVVTEKRHELRGHSFAGKVLVFPSAKGSSGWATVAQETRLFGNAPRAMIIRDINSLTAIGAVVMRVPTVTDLDQDPTEVISMGDWVKVDADNGTVEIIKKS